MKTRIIVKDILAPLRHLLKKLPEKNVVLILSLVVGVACGFAAVILKSAVEFIHHGLISWFDSEAYNYLYLIYPVIGMLIGHSSKAVFGSSRENTDVYSQKYSTARTTVNAKTAADLNIRDILDFLLTSYTRVLGLKIYFLLLDIRAQRYKKSYILL